MRERSKRRKTKRNAKKKIKVMEFQEAKVDRHTKHEKLKKGALL